MNVFFHQKEYRRGFPRRAYARLDDLEPIVATPDDDLTFVFDAVDADWPGFGSDGPFDLAALDLEQRQAKRWHGGFDGVRFEGPDGYEEVPVYRIELTLPRRHRLFEVLPRDEEPWITLELSKVPSDTRVDVYGGLFAPPVTAYLHSAPGPAPATPLGAIFDMSTWPDAGHAQLIAALSPQCELEALVCFDVGQGSATALVCRCGMPIYYFDTGRGSGRNAPTAPSRIDFCTCTSPAVVMSHWDTDHWAGAAGHARLQGQTWIVPRQTISTSHAIFGNDILKAGGRILVVRHGAPPLTWSSASQDYDLRRCTGKKRNGTGLALVVTDRASGRSWVLTGDAGYHEMPHPLPNDVAAMVAPHHGADMGSRSIPFGHKPTSYGRLFYSFGPGNGHGPRKPPVQHPVGPTVRAHVGAGWGHGTWSSSKPALSVAGGDVLATAAHASTHLDGGAAGWNGPPTLGHLAHCPDALSVPQN